jgi:hypothetical protein
MLNLALNTNQSINQSPDFGDPVKSLNYLPFDFFDFERTR